MTRPAVHDERDAGIACCGCVPPRRGSGSVRGDRGGDRGGDPSVRLVAAVLVVAVVVAVVNNSMVTVVLPEIRQDLGASAAAAGWVVTGFALTFAVGAVFYGRASDVFGIRAVFCAGLAVFIAGSLLAAWDAGMPGLLVGRLVQGAGAAAIPSLASVTVTRVFPPGRRGFAFGLIGTGLGAGQAIGTARRFIAAQGYDPVYGARPLRRFIAREVETRIARALVADTIVDGSQVEVDLKDDEIVVSHTAPAEGAAA